MEGGTHDDLGEEALLLGQKLVELAAVLEFRFCVTRKLPDPLHDPPALGTPGPRLRLLPIQHCQLRLLHSLPQVEKLQHWVLLLQPLEGAHQPAKN